MYDVPCRHQPLTVIRMAHVERGCDHQNLLSVLFACPPTYAGTRVAYVAALPRLHAVAFFQKQRKHRQVRAVFRLVEHLCPRLGDGGLRVLYDHLRELPPHYEEMHVELIRQFAEAASGWGARGSGGGGGGAEKRATPDGEG